MSEMALHYMRSDPQLLSKRLSNFVSPLPAKELSRRIGCDVRTAENIRAGHWPIARHWIGLLSAFGEDLTEAVFHPEKAAQRLEREVRDLEEQLAKRRVELRNLSGDLSGVAQVRSAPKDGSAPLVTAPIHSD